MTIRSPLFLLALVFLFACRAHAGNDLSIQIDPKVNPWSKLTFNNAPENFQFAIVADRTGIHRGEIFEKALTKVALLGPQFVMSVGDLIEGNTEDEQEIDRQWDEIQGWVGKLRMPFFYVPGNHDLSNPVQEHKWAKRFGRTYYHFVYRGVLFCCLNTEDGKPGAISDAQIKYFEQVLADNTGVRWTICILHRPMWAGKPEEITEWTKFEPLLQGRPYTVFAGHWHHYLKSVRDGRNYFVLATSGGTSPLRGTAEGEFDEVAWVTMTPNGPRVANILIDGVLSEDGKDE